MLILAYLNKKEKLHRSFAYEDECILIFSTVSPYGTKTYYILEFKNLIVKMLRFEMHFA